MKDGKPLGRGLSSLIQQNSHSQSQESSEQGTQQPDQGQTENVEQPTHSSPQELYYIAVDQIVPNPYQPRETFDEEALAELADSIAKKGVLQPLVVTKSEEKEETYVLIAGERRLRASKQAGLASVPAIIQDTLSDAEQAQLALIENLQRQDLDPMERARGIADLQKRFRFTQEQIAQNLHISRSRIANTLRLLSLPPRVQAALSEQKITEGHAKIIAGLPDQEAQEKLLNTILKHTLNVRDTESLVKTSPQSYTKGVNERVKNLANQMSEQLNAKVEIRPRKDRYVVTLNVSSEDDLESLAQKLNI